MEMQWQPQGPIGLQWVNACYHYISFSFDMTFLKLTDKVDMDESSDKSKNWPDRIITLSVTSALLLKKPL